MYPNDRGGMTVLVDGVDLSNYVLGDGIMIEFRHGVAYVTLPLAPSLLHTVLPDAVVNALSPECEPGVTSGTPGL